MRKLRLAALLAAPAWAHAHDVLAAPPPSPGWSFEPWVVALLLVSSTLYAVGLARLYARSVKGRSALRRQGAYFAAGTLALVAALLSPIDAAGSLSFTAHMVQHELLMIVAAPLLVLGRPFGAWMWSMPAAWRTAIGAAVHAEALQAAWRAITRPLSAWVLHAAALWLWHAPPLFQAALANNTVHAWQHSCFLVSALLFWWAVLDHTQARPAHGASMIYLFTTMMHTGALGALFALSGEVWYPAYAEGPTLFGLSPLEDQQLGGLIMWVPGGLAYVIAGLAMCATWLRRAPAPLASTLHGAPP